ncbi:MAG: hypothetical protein LBG92_07205 [Prevotellaceae bacterium]|jgi:hypothetical protein|nr:hypothetical protein [Prevotellaceae bacterium]
MNFKIGKIALIGLLPIFMACTKDDAGEKTASSVDSSQITIKIAESR